MSLTGMVSVPPFPPEPTADRPLAATDRDAQMALIGHDLRAAVAEIVGGLRLIDQSGLSDAVTLQLGRIRAASEGLARLVEDALSMVLGEEDFAATHPATVQIPRLVSDTGLRWSARAQEKGLTFHIGLSPAVPRVLVLDRAVLDRILTNLLSNAFKHSDRGTVRLDIGLSEQGALRFEVTDDGPGFSPDALARLFAFGGRPDDSARPGDGLGLFIAQNLSRRMGGTLGATNRPGGGACLCLEIPPDRWTLAAADTLASLPDLSRVKILVADDSPTNRSIMATMLTRMGAQFELAEDGVEAMHWLERESFDLALIDIEMPRLSGFDLIRALRSHDRQHAQMPIIAVTAYVLRSVRDAIYAAGADAIVTKPLAGIDTFGSAIAAALDRGSSAAPAGHASERPAPSAAFDRSRFDHLLGIAGTETAAELLERLDADLQSVEHGLQQAFASHDASAMRSQTHMLIALAGAVGDDALVDQAQQVNALAHRRHPGSFGAPAQAMQARLRELIRFIAAERRGAVHP